MLSDLKFAWRRLRHSPAFTITAVLTLALTIGANTAILGVADAVLFRPLPYADADRIFIIQMLNRQTGSRYLAVPNDVISAIDRHHPGVGSVARLDQGPRVVATTAEGAEVVPTTAVSANYFQVLGVQAARGRVFEPADAERGGRPALLTFAAWRQRFGGDESIVGRSVQIGTHTFDIVGVLPRGFVFASMFGPAAAQPAHIVTLLNPATFSDPRGNAFHPIVRLEPGVTREQAQAQMDSVIGPIVAGNPQRASSLPVLDDIRTVLYPVGRPIMRFLLAAGVLVLLIGCANLANMLVARIRSRERETGVRAALGAGRLRLVRPVVFEGLMIGIAGAIVAVLLTTITFGALLRQVPPIAYRGAPVGIDLRVGMLTLMFGLLAGLLFAVLPAWRSARFDIQDLIQSRQRAHKPRGRALGSPMVVVQVALAVALVFGAVVAGRAFLSVLRVPLGFDATNVIRIGITPASIDPAARHAFYIRVLETLRQRPDVVSAGAAGSLPLDGSAPDEGASLPGSKTMIAGIVHVLPGYFETVGMTLVRGRLPTWEEARSGADVAVVSEAAARVLAGDREVLGARFTNGRDRELSVIGVVGDVRRSLRRDPREVAPVYALPGARSALRSIVVRTRTRQDSVLNDIKREVATLTPGVPVGGGWWSDSISNVTEYRNPRFQTLVLGGFATLALGVTALGVFAAVAFMVAARTHELGVRLAIGARPGSLIGLMIRATMMPVGIGLIGGIVATRWLGRLAEAQLFEVNARDPATLAAAGATVIVTALVAAWLPARRAGRLDPLIVLKAE